MPIFVPVLVAFLAAQDPVEELRQEIQRLRQEYEERIRELESRLELLQTMVETPPPPPPPAQPELPNIFNPRVTIFGNMTARADSRAVRIEEEEEERVDNRFSMRETELDFRASIDPYAEGVLITALHEHAPGEFELGLEEGYALIKRLPLPLMDEPPWGLKIKGGRFRTQFGRINLLHTHDLPQTTRPLAVRQFLGEEGSIGNGLSGSVFVPLEWLDELSTLQLTAEGWTGELPGADDDRMQGLVNLSWSRPLGDDHRVDLSGIVHFGQTESEAGEDPVRTYSVDFLYQWRPPSEATWRGAVVGAQAFWPVRRIDEQEYTRFGWYAFAQYQFNRLLFAGVRYDETESIEILDADMRSIQPYVSWYPSEFLRVRFAYEHTWFNGLELSDLGTLWVELNWVFGSHPPEPYWVHR